MRRLAAGLVMVLALSTAAMAAPPEILEVRIDRGRDTNMFGWVGYHQRVTVRVQAAAPGDTLGALKVTDPDGRVFWIGTTTSGGAWDVDPAEISRFTPWQREEADGSYTCWFTDEIMPAPPGPGTYRIEIAANDADLAVLTTAAAPAVPEEAPEPVAPAMEAVIDDTVPTFQWTNAFAGNQRLVVREEGNVTYTDPLTDDGAQVWSAAVTGTEAVYNFDTSATRGTLMPGRSYFWEVRSTRLDDDFGTDPRVQLTTTQTLRRHFTMSTTWPALPALPGKLAYTGALWGDWSWDSEGDGLLQYGQSITSRKWLAPESSSWPNWSADGTKLLYYRNDLGLWIESFDGSQPVHIPVDAWGSPTWSPDNQQVAYDWVPPGAGLYQVWVMGVDGSDARVLAERDTEAAEEPRWSPDGAWVAYSVHPADWSFEQIWLVHPDGTGDQQLEATGVAGYPGWVVGGMSQQSWSPDGQKLAVAFWANSEDGTLGIAGIGAIPRSGGLVTPIFLAPPGIECCASPQGPTYSPSGTQIAFISGHHLTPDPEWESGKFEPGVEVWLISADGSGDPVRLTYDFMHHERLAWWAAPAFTDVAPGNWAYSAVSTCAEAGIVQGYDDGYHPEREVDRASMAAYISRGLAGGDANVYVPTGLAEPSFTDVGADHWAYRYIEYAAAANVVQGYGDGSYQPDIIVDRGQMAVYIARAMLSPTGDAALPDPPSSPAFSDVTADNEWSWCRPHVEYLAAHEIVRGYSDGTYHPEQAVTRDQMAVYIARAFRLPM
jgi:hypothetical protein